MRKLLCVIGTRPQAVKHWPFVQEMANHYKLINLHTGQHYDSEMKEAFLSNINLDVELELLATQREKRLSEMLVGISKCIENHKPDMLVVYGDTDSTLAAAYAARDCKIPLCHIEAGLRSHNLDMPEEYNRIETDKLSQLLLCPSQEALDQLRKENITFGVYLVGDIMKDVILLSKRKISILEKRNYYYATLHRPYNVDQKSRLKYVLDTLNRLEYKVILPLHPRTQASMCKFEISNNLFSNIEFISPQSYLSNLKYMMGSKAIITDSGGMQKEAYWLQKKCVTLRSETEWKETIHDGCNILMFDDINNLQEALNSKSGIWDCDLYGDGNARGKIKDVIDEYFKRA